MPRLKRDDVELEYEIRGSGEPVLFIQGVGVGGSGWLPQVEGVSDRWQTLTYDNRTAGAWNTSGRHCCACGGDVSDIV